jgi:surfactin synthase thioesterase subunit
LRLFCVPFAGGGASAFNAWSNALPDSVEIQAVQLPGRESRHREPALADLREAAKLIVGALESYLDRRYAFFGYSMGALIAFEVICELRRRGAPLPAQLFVGAMRAPALPAMLPALAQLPVDAFLTRVRHYYEPPAVTWENLDLLELVLPVLRADMALCESYVYRSEPPFDFPIQAFAGLRDRSVPIHAVQAWRAQTTGDFAVELFDGGHFFLNASLARMHAVMISRLNAVLGDAGA